MKQIEGFPGYQVSEDGRIWSDKSKKFLSPGDNGWGYLMVILMRDGKRVHKKVHRLVAEAFIPNPENLPQVDHRDCNKSNNCVSNLRWVTNQENQQAAWDMGLNERCREAARESCRKLGKASSKPVRCIETGRELPSAREASRFLGKCDRAVDSAINRGHRCGGYTFEYVS